MATLDDSMEAFQRMVTASKAFIADPTNKEKQAVVEQTMKEYRRIHREALRDAGFQQDLIGDNDD